MNLELNSDSLLLKDIAIENLYYVGAVNDEDFIVKSIQLLGYLEGSDPIIVCATEDPTKFKIIKGKKRVRGAHLSGKIRLLPCVIVNKTYKSKKSRFDDLAKYLTEPRCAYFFIVKILDAVHSGSDLAKNLPLNDEYFLLIQKLTKLKRKSTERALSVLRDIYKTKVEMSPEMADLQLFKFFETMRLSGDYPELQKFYLDSCPWRLVEDYKKRKSQDPEENIAQKEADQKLKKQFLNKLLVITEKQGANSSEAKLFISDFFAKNSAQKSFFQILSSNIISLTAVKSGKSRKSEANTSSMFD